MTRRVYGDCPYCDRPATSSGACGLHEELLEGEPDALAKQLEKQLELAEDGPEPADRHRRLRRRARGVIIPRRTSTD